MRKIRSQADFFDFLRLLVSVFLFIIIFGLVEFAIIGLMFWISTAHPAFWNGIGANWNSFANFMDNFPRSCSALFSGALEILQKDPYRLDVLIMMAIYGLLALFAWLLFLVYYFSFAGVFITFLFVVFLAIPYVVALALTNKIMRNPFPPKKA